MVGWLVGRLVGWSVGLLVGWLVGRLLERLISRQDLVWGVCAHMLSGRSAGWLVK